MKKAGILFSSLPLLFTFLFLQGRAVSQSKFLADPTDTTRIHYSGNLKSIMDSKCYGCHSNSSKSEKARRKLNLDSLSLITKVAQISKMDKIIETLDKGEMPPKKYLERKPEGKLSAEETKVIKDWAQKTSDVLLK